MALAVGHFLLETQRRNDPLGFRLFEVSRRIVQCSIKDGSLVLVAGDHRIRNESLVARPGEWDVRDLRETHLQPLTDLWVLNHLEKLMTATHAPFTTLCVELGQDLGRLARPAAGGRFSIRQPRRRSEARGARGLGLPIYRRDLEPRSVGSSGG